MSQIYFQNLTKIDCLLEKGLRLFPQVFRMDLSGYDVLAPIFRIQSSQFALLGSAIDGALRYLIQRSSQSLWQSKQF